MERLAELICEIGRRGYARKLIASTEGNLSCRIDDERVLCTPTGMCNGLLTPDDLCVIDRAGRKISGRRSPSSEAPLHLAVYAADLNVRAVIHSHPTYATTFAVVGETLPRGFVPETEVLLGPVPLVEYETPGTTAFGAAVAAHVPGHVIAILQNHGVIAWGPDLETVYHRTETLEAACRVAFQARQIGQVHHIPPDKLRELAALREKRSASAQ